MRLYGSQGFIYKAVVLGFSIVLEREDQVVFYLNGSAVDVYNGGEDDQYR